MSPTPSPWRSVAQMPTRLDTRGLRKLVAAAKNAGDKGELALKRAKIDVARGIKAEARREFQAKYNMKPTRILRGLSSRSSADSVDLTAAGDGINISEYGAKWRGRKSKGAEVVIRKGGPKQVRVGTFIARGANQNRVGLQRKEVGGKRVARDPLVGVYGPSVAQQLKDEGSVEALVDYAAEKLTSRLDRLLK